MNQPKSKNQAKSKPTNKTEGLEIVSQKDSPIDVKGKVVETQTKYAKIARQCDHVMTNGEFCRAVALRGRKYCFFHLIHIGRRLRAERVHELAMAIQCDSSAMAMELPLLEDANAIQLALSQVIDDVMHSRLDNKRAGLVLYALQTASANLANGVDLGQRDGATAACRYDDFEEDYQLGCTAPELKVEEEPVAEGLPEDPHKTKRRLVWGTRAARDRPTHSKRRNVWGTRQNGAGCAEPAAGGCPRSPFTGKEDAGVCVCAAGEQWLVAGGQRA
ncbi:MAG: hypothetical protein ACLPPV_11095 [Candidatus Korobacteraceae bacterium]